MPPREKPAPTVLERLAELAQQSEVIAAGFEQIARQNCRGEERLRLELTLNCASAALRRIESAYGLYPNEQPS